MSDRQKAIRKAALDYAEQTGGVDPDSLGFLGFGAAEVRSVLRDLYELGDLERTTRGTDVRYHIPTIQRGRP